MPAAITWCNSEAMPPRRDYAYSGTASTVFARRLWNIVDRTIAPEDRHVELRIDAEAPLPQLTLRTVDQIQQLAPFGQANPRPLLCASQVRLDGAPRCMGEGNRHLSLRVKQQAISLRAVAFGQGEWAAAMESQQGPIDIVYRPSDQRIQWSPFGRIAPCRLASERQGFRSQV